MSSRKNNEDNGSTDITTRDLFGSIPKPIELDPFEGIDLEAISVYSSTPRTDELGEDISEINPLEGFDIEDIVWVPGGQAEAAQMRGTQLGEIPSLEGIDTQYISIAHVRKPEAARESEPGPVSAKKTAGDATSEVPPEETTPAPEQPKVSLISEEVGKLKKGLSSLFKRSAKPKKASTPEKEDAEAFTAEKASQIYSQVSRVGKDVLGKARKIKGKKAKRIPAVDTPETLSARLRKGYVYSEINRIRESIVTALEKENSKTVAFTSPHDDAGNTFLITLLGFNTAYFTNMKTLLVDLNMRRPQLHLPFKLKQEKGFTEVAAGALHWRDAIKDTGLSELKMLTAGKKDNELYLVLTPGLLEDMIKEMRDDFDLVFFDTSPILNQNRNNVDPVFLSMTCDMVLMLVQDKVTNIEQLNDSVEAITKEGGTVDGIIYNHQF